jgi:hypothetical protein
MNFTISHCGGTIKMSKYVISTLTADTRYTNWTKSEGVNLEGRSVVVRGGAGIVRGVGKDAITPQALRTEVSDDDAAFLEAHPHFQEHVKKGFARIANRADDPEKAARSMGKDASRPKTGKDVEEENKKANKDDGSPPLQALTNKAK